MNSSMAFIPAAAPDSIFRNPEDFHVDLSDFLLRRSAATSFSEMDRADELQPDDDMSDDGSQMLGEKKRRLNLEQVRALEKSFELGNKLEPERKMQLARALGLQPRQIAIWFQNRRARWKTKQLEKDYDVLKRQFEALKADNDALKSQNKNLQTQLMALKTRKSAGSGTINLNKENEGCWSNGSDDNSRDVVNLNQAASTDSTLYPHHHFQASRNAAAAASGGLTRLLHSSSRPDHHFQLSQKVEQVPISNDGFCNMFSGIEDQTQDFWPWSEHQNFQ